MTLFFPNNFSDPDLVIIKNPSSYGDSPIVNSSRSTIISFPESFSSLLIDSNNFFHSIGGKNSHY